MKKVLLNFDGNTVSFSDEVKHILTTDKTNKIWFEDLVTYNLLRFQNDFGSCDYGKPFLKLYAQYSMRDTALLCNYKKIHSSFRGQGLLTSAKPDYFIFVNLHKNADIKESINTFHLSMQSFACEIVSGDLELLEHENAYWLTKETLLSVKWLPEARKIPEEP